MGFDVSFHPFSTDEIRTYFFDVLAAPEKAEEAAGQVSTDPGKQAQLLELYHVCSMVLPDVRAGNEPFSASIGFALAAVAGFLHPYWYSRGGSISALHNNVPHFPMLLQSLTTIFHEELQGIEDDQNGMLEWNNQVGGCVALQSLPQLREALDKYSAEVDEVLDKDGRHGLLQAITYCETHGLHLLEATDVAVPVADDCISDMDNFRAGFLGTADNLQNARVANTGERS